jgi:hypothetical protein
MDLPVTRINHGLQPSLRACERACPVFAIVSRIVFSFPSAPIARPKVHSENQKRPNRVRPPLLHPWRRINDPRLGGRLPIPLVPSASVPLLPRRKHKACPPIPSPSDSPPLLISRPTTKMSTKQPTKKPANGNGSLSDKHMPNGTAPHSQFLEVRPPLPSPPN